MSLEGHSCGPKPCWECGEEHGCICGNGCDEEQSTQVDQAPTLGDMAEVMKGWLALGVTRDSTLYVVDKVFWEDLERQRRAAETAAAIRTEVRAAYLAGVPDKHNPEL